LRGSTGKGDENLNNFMERKYLWACWYQTSLSRDPLPLLVSPALPDDPDDTVLWKRSKSAQSSSISFILSSLRPNARKDKQRSQPLKIIVGHEVKKRKNYTKIPYSELCALEPETESFAWT